jgi:predicted ATP-dependent endonuclease of OLD family
VGENNVGKSSVLRALNIFFNFESEKEFFIDRSHQHSPRGTAKIELSFSDINNMQKYSEYIYKGKLVIRLSCYVGSTKRKLQYKTNEYNDLSLDFLKLLKEDINFVLIPNNRDHSQLSWDNENVLRKLIDEQLRIITCKRDTLSSQVKNVAENFEKTALSKISKDLGKYYSVNRSFDFVLGYDEDIDYKLLLNNLSDSVPKSSDKSKCNITT